ncbi:MAG TPA: glycosyltransferase family 2 protein [Ktedonobacterales bacterium]|jgi:glycosyltransferase involved in cell wall biosynthesis
MTDQIFVSIVMPVRNEEAFIARSLGAVLNQDYPHESIEILIADGESSDRTLEIMHSLSGMERVRIICNPQRTQAAGLNKAIQQARGAIIIRVDGHTIIAPDYVRQCVSALQETGACNVGGLMNPVGITRMGKAIAGAIRSPFAVPSAFHISRKKQYTDTVYMGAWPRWVFERVGAFDERLAPNEDYELNYRIHRAGGEIYLSPNIRSHYFGRQTLRTLARQYFYYGKAKTNTLKKHPASLRLRQLVAPCFVGALLGGIPLAVMIPLSLWLWLLMLVAYLSANLIFSLAAARRIGYRYFWCMPFVFPTIHLAWGAGFWVGLVGGGVRLPRRKH